MPRSYFRFVPIRTGVANVRFQIIFEKKEQKSLSKEKTRKKYTLDRLEKKIHDNNPIAIEPATACMRFSRQKLSGIWRIYVIYVRKTRYDGEKVEQ